MPIFNAEASNYTGMQTVGWCITPVKQILILLSVENLARTE